MAVSRRIKTGGMSGNHQLGRVRRTPDRRYSSRHDETGAFINDEEETEETTYSSVKIESIVPPTGAIFEYIGNTAPDGYLICDGSSIDREKYSDLFNIIGTGFGSENDATFKLPNANDYDLYTCSDKAGSYQGVQEEDTYGPGSTSEVKKIAVSYIIKY